MNETSDNEGNDAEIPHKMLEEAMKKLGKEACNAFFEKLAASPIELKKYNVTLQHSLRADPDGMKVYYIDNLGSVDETETEIVEERDPDYLSDLETENKILLKEVDENGKSRFVIDEIALEDLVNKATKFNFPFNRAKRAAQVANTIQPPDIDHFKDAGEMFLQQVVYNPIVELFCAYSRSYCTGKKVTCAQTVFCNENGNNVRYSVSCFPDAALRLVDEFYLIAMMELKSDGKGDAYKKDFYRCVLMTAMSVMAIADYLVENDKIERSDIDLAIPFLQGHYKSVDLYVMRLQGKGSPKIHYVSATKFWDSPNSFGKLDLLSKLAVILARIVAKTFENEAGMEGYFGRNHNRKAAALNRNAINDLTKKKGILSPIL